MNLVEQLLFAAAEEYLRSDRACADMTPWSAHSAAMWLTTTGSVRAHYLESWREALLCEAEPA